MIYQIDFSIALYRRVEVSTEKPPTEQELRRIATASARQTVDPEAVVVVTCARKVEGVTDLEEVWVA
jgi:hypothetical protein